MYEAQTGEGSGEDPRIILSLRDSDGKVLPDKHGDINETLEVLEREWAGNSADLVQGKSLLEVGVTRRLLYAGLVRFGNRMLVTPYRDGGLFNQSAALLFTNRSPLFRAYAAEFNSIWDNVEDTRLAIHATGTPGLVANPVKRLMRNGHRETDHAPPFNYERWLVSKAVKERISAWLSGKVTPPYEVEVQPSSQCTLHCAHCIGLHLAGSSLTNRAKLSAGDLPRFHSLFNWQEGGFKVERIRISGLSGDPLAGC